MENRRSLLPARSNSPLIRVEQLRRSSIQCVKTKVLKKALHKAGQEILHMLTKDKWMPQPVNQAITNTFRSVWPEVESVLSDLLCDKVDSAAPKKSKIDKRPWPTAPPDWRKQPLRWFRARMIYAMFPADATFWYKARQPGMLLFLVLLVIPYFGIATIMWLILLVFIDWDCDPPPPPPPPLRDHTHPHPHHTRTGDFQLVNFIALQRVTAFFVYGLLPACKGFVGYAWCVNDMALGNPLACDEAGPGVSQSDMMKFVQRQVESWASAELSGGSALHCPACPAPALSG